MKRCVPTAQRPNLLIRAGLIGLLLTAIQSALPMKIIGTSREVLETRHGFPYAWMVIDRRGTQARFHVEPLILIPDFAFYGLLTAFILWGRNQIQVERRRRTETCLNCGYNLTGNVSGVCPECGKAK